MNLDNNVNLNWQVLTYIKCNKFAQMLYKGKIFLGATKRFVWSWLCDVLTDKKAIYQTTTIACTVTDTSWAFWKLAEYAKGPVYWSREMYGIMTDLLIFGNTIKQRLEITFPSISPVSVNNGEECFAITPTLVEVPHLYAWVTIRGTTTP